MACQEKEIVLSLCNCMWNFRTDKSIKRLTTLSIYINNLWRTRYDLLVLTSSPPKCANSNGKTFLKSAICQSEGVIVIYINVHTRFGVFCIMPIQYTTESKDQTIFGPIMKITVNKSVYSISLKQNDANQVGDSYLFFNLKPYTTNPQFLFAHYTKLERIYT